MLMSNLDFKIVMRSGIPVPVLIEKRKEEPKQEEKKKGKKKK
jgi:hypothetical protein